MLMLFAHKSLKGCTCIGRNLRGAMTYHSQCQSTVGLWLPKYQKWGVMGNPPGKTGHCLTARAHPATAVREQDRPGAALDTSPGVSWSSSTAKAGSGHHPVGENQSGLGRGTRDRHSLEQPGASTLVFHLIFIEKFSFELTYCFCSDSHYAFKSLLFGSFL